MTPPPPHPTPRGKGGFDIVKIFDDPKAYVLKNIFFEIFFLVIREAYSKPFQIVNGFHISPKAPS